MNLSAENNDCELEELVAERMTELTRINRALQTEIAELRLANAALRASEEKYRTVFETIDEGFCVQELVRDERGEIADIIYREANQAFELHSGVGDVVGKRASELFPRLEQFWLDAATRVQQTGVPERLEGYSADTERWLTLQFSPVGGAGSPFIAVVFNDVTSRKRAEERQAFLLQYSDLLRAQPNEQSIKEQTVKMVGEHLGADRCWIAEVFERRSVADVGSEHLRLPDLVPMTGVYQLSDYPEIMRQLVTQPIVNEDVAHDPRFPDFEKKLLAGLSIRALLVAPLRRGASEVVWALVATMTAPRNWSESERLLLEEVGERAWAAVERAKAEAALRESEERLRLVMESVTDYAIITSDTDGRITGWNPGAEKIFGWTANEALGQFTKIIFTPADRAANIPEREIETALREGRAEDERLQIRKDGSSFVASGVVTSLKEVNGRTEGFVKIARDMTERIAAEKARRDKELLQKMIGAQEDERRRIAHDIHDQLGQQLTALRLKLEILKASCDGDEKLCRQVDDTQVIAKQIDADIDFISWELRPSALDDIGLVAALERYVSEWSRNFGTQAEFEASRFDRGKRLSHEAETNLYRIAQEALNNVAKHARASHVSVSLERLNGVANLIIEDDGQGFDQSEDTDLKSIGVQGMRERARLVGGTLEIESASGNGTTVYVRIPYAREEARDE